MSKEDEIRERTTKLAVHLRETIGAYYGETDDKSAFPAGDILTALAALSGTLIVSLPENSRGSAVQLHLEVFSNACGATVTPVHPPQADNDAASKQRLH